MDDGNSWIGILLFAASVAVFYLIYGFGAAIQALNTSALEDERDEGNKKAAALLRIQEDPGKFVRTNQVVTCFFTLALGAFTLPQTAGYIRRFLAVKLAAGNHEVKAVYHIPYMKQGAVVSILGVLLLTGYCLWLYHRDRKRKQG